MDRQPTSKEGERKGATETVAIVIILVLALFIVIQVIGSPIVNTGGLGGSVVYSILVFLPVALVCALAVSSVRGR